LPAGSIVLDIETSDDTKTLALASAYHLESGNIYYWVAPVGEFDYLLDFPDNSLLIAHRAAFENSFIRQNYTASQPKYRSFCTFAYSATRLHPLKPSLYRAMQNLPMFQESSDCSLADLYERFTGKKLDKGDVEIFIKSQGDGWRTEEKDLYKEQKYYERYLRGELSTKTKLPIQLLKPEKWVYPPLPRKRAEKEDLWIDLQYRITTLSHEEKLLLHKLERALKREDPFSYEFTPLSEEAYYTEIEKLNPRSESKLRTGLLYNIRDTLATAAILNDVVDLTEEITPESFIGIQLRLQPIYALDPAFEKQRDYVENYWYGEKQHLQRVAEKVVYSHALIGDTWDGQDWEKNKKGRVKWLDPKKVGYTKTLCAIGSQIHYCNLPLKRIIASKPVKHVDGSWVFPTCDPSLVANPLTITNEKKRYWAYETHPRADLEYEDRLSLMDESSCTPLENPENTDPESYKSVVSFFSKTLLKYWKDGTFTCGVPEAQIEIKRFIATSYWTSIRKRMLALKIVTINGVKYAAPRPSVHGAVSGRSVDALFLVLAKYDHDKIGSELAGMFCCPPGYKIVAWDLDSCQARIAAVISDAWFAKRNGAKNVVIGSTGISKAVFFGSKSDRTTLAHRLGDGYLGFDLSDPRQADKSYTLGKNAQFSLIFGVGAKKLGKMLGIEQVLAEKLVEGWKGIKNPLKPSEWINGEASDLINAQAALSTRWYPMEGNPSIWTQHTDVLGVVGMDRLPHVLNPRYSGKDYITTKYNAFIQNGDVAMLNYALCHIDLQARHIDHRYNNSIHDYMSYFVRDDQVEEFVGIVNRVHKKCYEEFFTRWNVDFKSVPDNVWYPSTVDVCHRLVKQVSDERKENSMTVSFEGYDSLWGDSSLDEEELQGLETEE
jgi:hypothetical protein